MAKTRASAKAGRTYTSSKPPRQTKLRPITDKPRITRPPKGKARPPLDQNTMTQMPWFQMLNDNGNEENEAAADEEEEEEPRPPRKSNPRRRRTIGETLVLQDPDYRAKQNTLTQMASSWSALDDKEQNTDREAEEQLKRESSFTVFEDETADLENERPRKRSRRSRQIIESSDDESDGDAAAENVDDGGDENNEHLEKNQLEGSPEPVLESVHEEDIRLEEADGRNRGGTADYSKRNERWRKEEVADSDEEPDFDEDIEENHSEIDEDPKNNEVEEGAEVVFDSQNEHNLAMEDEVTDADKEAEENSSEPLKQTVVKSSPPLLNPSHSKEVQIRSSTEPKTPRKVRYEIPDSDAESEDVSPEKRTPLNRSSPNSSLVEDTPSRRTARFSTPIDLTTPVKAKPSPVPPSQATTVDHSQYLSSQQDVAQRTPTHKTPSRKTPTSGKTKKSPFVLRSSQLLTESQMLPDSLMASMPMPPRWIDSDEEDDEDDEL